MLIMQSSFRSTDFAAILSGIEKAAVPGLARVAVVGSAQFRCAWPSLHFDPFDRRYPPAPVRPEKIDAPPRHDPERCAAVFFRKRSHAKSKSQSAMTIRSISSRFK
jgi:hypothetical protein